MSTFKLSHLNDSGQTLYAVLFYEDQSIAFHSGILAFSIFDQSSINSYAWNLTEATSVRSGFYQSIDFASLITQATPISVEIKKQVGGSRNYAQDILQGVDNFVWNGQAHIDDHLIPRLESGDYLGTFNLNDYVRTQAHVYNEYGLLTVNTSGFNFAVFNPSGLSVATGVATLNSSTYPCHDITVRASGTGFGVGNYRLQVSGIYQGLAMTSNYYFTVATGTVVNATATVDILGTLGYASGSINDASPTTTSFVTTLSSSTDDFYNGQILRFTTGGLIGQGRIISDYVGATKTITLNKALSSTPSNGSNLIIYPIGGQLNVP